MKIECQRGDHTWYHPIDIVDLDVEWCNDCFATRLAPPSDVITISKNAYEMLLTK